MAGIRAGIRAGNRARIGTLALAAGLLAAVPGIVAAQSSRPGAVSDVPLKTGQGWTGGVWTGPEDGPDMRRLPVDERRTVATPAQPQRPMPPLRTDPPASAQFTGHYVRPYRGGTIPTYFTTPTFMVRDFPAWGLAPPGPGRSWVRYYGDAVLVDLGGRVVDVRYGVNWDRRAPMPMARHDGPRRPLPDRAYDSGYDDGYADGRDDGEAFAGDVDPAPGRYPPGTVITTTTPGTITTTTTVIEDVVYPGVRRRWAPARTKVWRAKSRRWSK